MKKRRILAALLCIMMVACSIPMMASAEISSELYNTIGGLMGKTSSRPVDNATWLSMNFDFKDNFSQTDSITMPEGASYDNTNGLTMPKGTYSTWKYFPSTLASQGWSPLVFGAYTLRFKLDEGGTLEAQACAYYQHARSFVSMSPTGVTVYTSSDDATIGSGMGTVTNLVDYQPGTDWNDMVVVANGGSANSENGYSVYMKKVTDSEFTKVASTGSYRSNGAWKSTGLTLSGNDSYVSDAVMLEGTDAALPTKYYNSIDEIMGGPVASSYAFDFDSTFDAASWERSGQGKLTSPDGATYTDEGGLSLAENATWNYYAYKAWSPFTANSVYAAYSPQAVYFQAKGTINVQFRVPDTSANYRFYIDLADNVALGTGGGTATESYSVTTDGGWMEYLIVPNAASATGGYKFYAKGATATNGKWTLVAATSGWRTGGGNTTGINFFGKATPGYIKSVRTYQLAAAEADTIPAGATLCYYNEEMAEAPAYQNLSAENVTFTDGYANFPATAETGNISYALNYAEIPVGGYAEFKARSNGVQNFSVSDGTNGVSMGINKDYGSVTGGNGYMADGSNTWRTYRIVRTDAGYSIYSKVDGDSGWLVSTTNAGAASNATPGIKLNFSVHANGTDTGSGQLDYLKIYGPASSEKLILTDGVGTKVLKDGDTLGYASTLRPILNVDSGKLLLVNYENGIVRNVQVIDPADLTVNSFYGVSKGNANTIKVFLWDSVDGNISNLTDVVNLTYPVAE